MKKALLILLFIIFYIAGNVRNVIHIPAPAVYYGLFTYCLILILACKRKWWKLEKDTVWIFAGCLVIVIARMLNGILVNSVQSLMILILPAVLISVFPKETEAKYGVPLKKSVRTFVDCFFCIECVLAIAEFITRHYLFGYVENTYAGGFVQPNTAAFRSVALLGSPLNNALVVTTMMMFYLFDPQMPPRRKLIFWSLGLVSVFCFNARSAIVINLSAMLMFIIKKVRCGNMKNKVKYISVGVLTCIFVFALYLLGLGNRLFETGGFRADNSIAVRLRVFEYLANADLRSYIFGHSLSAVQDIMQDMGVKIIENFWVMYVFLFGIIVTLFFAYMYFRIGRRLLRHYPLYDKLVISLLFIVLASTNNSVYSGFVPLFAFLLCCYMFAPVNENALPPRPKQLKLQ